ncbi:MAG TPA: RHS repeat-associated core domain-containing protein [Blastocatellia bacterium]|nr:RHS repeat-associated core domain-containing protein [Blastocatellia bacterium]
MQHVNAAGMAVEDYRYGYTVEDEISAITSLNGATQLPQPKNASAADAANRIGQFGAASYTFDAHGQRRTKTEAGGTTQYTWDARGRLTGVTLPNGQQVSYGYDALGRRASRTASGTTTGFLYDGADVVADKAGAGGVVDYLNAGLDAKLRQGAVGNGLYFLEDHLGSTQQLTNASGGVVGQMQYGPFGEHSASALTRYTYTGREDDPATGLIHYRAREYDPSIGRFLTEDPAGIGAGTNFYSYVSNNPISKTDPLGLYEEDVHYYLTYFLVANHPCFSGMDADIIANADQGVDENPDTFPGKGWDWNKSPIQRFDLKPKQQEQNQRYHALHPSQGAMGSGDLFSQALWQGSTQGSTRTDNIAGLGRYLHYFQDTFSHAGYTNPMYGHAFGTHNADKTVNDVDKTLRMAKATWEELNRWARQMGCKCDTPWNDSLNKRIREFAEIDATGFAGLGLRTINPEEIEKKARGLGVPGRYQRLPNPYWTKVEWF